jgi:hypothetical protein
MTRTLFQLIFDEWAAQFERPEPAPNLERRMFLRRALPANHRPAVGATFRGPKWGTR